MRTQDEFLDRAELARVLGGIADAAKFAAGWRPCETSPAYPAYARWLRTQPRRP